MENINFEWVPFFNELAIKLLEYENNQIELISILEKIGIEKGLSDQDSCQELQTLQDPIRTL